MIRKTNPYHKRSGYLNGEKVTTTNTSYEFTDLEPNTSYTIEVEAVDATGNVSGKTTTTINTKAEEVIAPEPSEPEDNPTAVSESSISIVVYPNPVTDELHINTNIGNYTVELKDMNGRQLMFEANTSTINMSDYATGIYLIQINDGEKISNLKIIKR